LIGLQELTINKNIKSQDLAKEIGINPSEIWRWFRDNKIPKIRLKQLADIFNVEENYLTKVVNDINTYQPRVKGFNNYKIIDDITEIYVTKKNGVKVTFLIDTEDLARLIELNYSWNATYDEGVDNYYGTSSQVSHLDEKGRRCQRTILLHETILGVKYVDHISNDTKDNRKINLRPTTYSPNLRNRKGRNKNNKSGIRNVSWNGSGWSVQLMVEGKNTCLKRFKKNELKEAGEYAEKMRQELYGEWAGKGEKL